MAKDRLTEIINEAIRKVLSEGIDVDDSRKVTMTDKHENNVDTSVENNPTMVANLVPNMPKIKVWSIFRRKADDPTDGNPMLYALKGEKNYQLTNGVKVKSRIEYIANRFLKENDGFDVTIMIPSTNGLNQYLASVIGRGCKNPKYIGDVLLKLTVEEVLDWAYDDNSFFRKKYGNKFREYYKMLKNYCLRMPDGMFRLHDVHDNDLRKNIEHTIKLNDELCAKYYDAINDKNVLIVDDSIKNGTSLKEACEIISKYYNPKSITVLTLFSPLSN